MGFILYAFVLLSIKKIMSVLDKKLFFLVDKLIRWRIIIPQQPRECFMGLIEIIDFIKILHALMPKQIMDKMQVKITNNNGKFRLVVYKNT